ncbi:DUF4386 domain-containing protein [Cohnella mopanensis]|uniref:DUF4386 domain-containing protein n=1 Tax=Cohnella mopanensis TaxID=2911966 RepID=UPI001EF7FC45|nr:DUF4386 domain-containing protein [Cohnella mopanensis]
MNTKNIKNNLSLSLGVAFFLQAFTSLASGAFLFNPLVVTGDISKTMLNIGDNAILVHASIIGDIITALGIIFLAAILFTVVKRQNKTMALAALGFYIFEAGILAVSKFVTFVLLNISQEYVATGDKAFELMGTLALEAKDFIYRIHIIPFGLGAIIFYYLLYKSNAIPKWLSLWGLMTVPFVIIGVVFTIYGDGVPFVFLLPSVLYVPFEFFTGIYILVKGFKVEVLQE